MNIHRLISTIEAPATIPANNEYLQVLLFSQKCDDVRITVQHTIITMPMHKVTIEMVLYDFKTSILDNPLFIEVFVDLLILFCFIKILSFFQN